MARLIRLFVAAFVLLTPAVQLAQEKSDDKSDSPAAPPAGTWKVFMPYIGKEGTGGEARYIVRFEKKEDRWQSSIVAKNKEFPKGTIDTLSVTDRSVKFRLKVGTLPVLCELNLPKEGKGARLYGSAVVKKQATPLELEATKATSLEPIDLIKERFEKEPPGYLSAQLGLTILGSSEAQKLDPKIVRATAEKVVRSAALYGSSFQRSALLDVAATLTDEKGYEKIALEYARRAERALDAKEAPGIQKRVLEILKTSLEQNKREEEVKTIQARIAKLDFRIKLKMFAGRKAKSDRVVVFELFTGAQCLPCIAADLAFDAIAKSYKPSEVILLQYHLHFPGPDPLTSPDSEGRAAFYDEAVPGTPVSLFNGRPGASGGGDRDDAAEKYDDYREAIDPLLETDAGASLTLTASQKGTKITINTEVGKLAEVGDDMRLRLALVEEDVQYKGANGQALHHQVVRSMPGGVNGTPLKEKTLKKTFTVDVEEVRKQLKDYLEKYDMKRPFPNKDRPLELKKLRVVAYVQNDKTGEILQAAQVDVKGE